MGNDSHDYRAATLARRQNELDAAPECLRPMLQSCFDHLDAAIWAMTQKNRLKVELNRLKQLQVTGEQIERMEAALKAAEEPVTQARANAVTAGQIYQDALFQYRLEQFPEAHREQARALLIEEKEAIQAAADSAHITSGEAGTRGGTFFRLEAMLKRARLDGDEARVTTLEPQLELARSQKDEVLAMAQEIRRQQASIKADYAEKLRQLMEG